MSSRPVRIGLVDSGINPNHRQVGRVVGGVSFHLQDSQLIEDEDWLDQLGHGTAAAATITGLAPEAELYAIRVFRRRLQARAEAVLAAVDWALGHELDLLNCSLGITDARWAGSFRDLAERADGAGLAIVAVAEVEGQPTLLSLAPSVLRVKPDAALEAGVLRVDDDGIAASPWAREIPGLPRENNLRGASMAVASVTGRIGQLWQQGEWSTPAELRQFLLRLSKKRIRV